MLRRSLCQHYSQLLLLFAIEFDRESKAPLALSANTLRVLGEKPVRASDLPLLTGGSPETSGVGWQLKPYVIVEVDETAKRGRRVRLTPLGLKAQQTYHRLVSEIENRWARRFGQDEIRHLRQSLQSLLEQRDGHRLLLSVGLIPPQGVARAGYEAPALGRVSVGRAARQRMRDLVAQTKTFVRDPLGALSALSGMGYEPRIRSLRPTHRSFFLPAQLKPTIGCGVYGSSSDLISSTVNRSETEAAASLR